MVERSESCTCYSEIPVSEHAAKYAVADVRRSAASPNSI